MLVNLKYTTYIQPVMLKQKQKQKQKQTRRFSNHESRLISQSHTFAIIVILDLKIQIKVCGYTDTFFFQKLEPKVIDP